MATLRITTQYYENYSDSQTPHWKPKGGQTFIIKDIEGDMIMYCDNLTEVCSNLISAKTAMTTLNMNTEIMKLTLLEMRKSL